MTRFWMFPRYKTREDASMFPEQLKIIVIISSFTILLLGIPVGVGLLTSVMVDLPVWTGVMLGFMTSVAILFLNWVLIEWKDSTTIVIIGSSAILLFGVPAGVGLLTSVTLDLPVWTGVVLGLLTSVAILFLNWLLIEWSDLAIIVTIGSFAILLFGVPVGVGLLTSARLGLPVWTGIMVGLLTPVAIIFLNWILIEWSDSETRDESRK